MAVLGEEPTDFHVRIGTELESSKELEHQYVAIAQGRIALFRPHQRDGLGALGGDRLEQVGGSKLEPRTAVGFDRLAKARAARAR